MINYMRGETLEGMINSSEYKKTVWIIGNSEDYKQL